MTRGAGILMHITSLPSKYGIGTIGKGAFEFVDFLKKSGQKYWQILPVGPTGFGDSPYQSFSIYAGNSYLIDLELLCEDGLLTKAECESVNWGNSPDFIDYERIYNNRFEILKKAYNRYKTCNQNDFDVFKEKNNHWLFNYAMYMAIKKHFNMLPWSLWPDESIKNRDRLSIQKYADMLFDDINCFMFIQFIFYSQWEILKRYANSLEIKIIGDMPIYVGMDSADTWVHPEIFCLDEKLNPINVAGCPPDAFSSKGQLWGNPLYNWNYLKKSGYTWWINRVKNASELFDVIRIDHFRGFDSYYAIPYGAEDAVNGEWLIGPGIDFFNYIKENLGEVDIIAEDLGFLTESVKNLLKDTNYPGMKILQFGFDSDENNDFLPHNYTKNSVVYTGTHDNNTIVGWFNNASEKEKIFVSSYAVLDKLEGINWGMIRLAYASVCDIAIIPFQDFLGLDDSARMNIPSTIGQNWKWRARKEYFDDGLSNKIKGLTKLYGRL